MRTLYISSYITWLYGILSSYSNNSVFFLFAVYSGSLSIKEKVRIYSYCYPPNPLARSLQYETMQKKSKQDGLRWVLACSPFVVAEDVSSS